MLPIIILLPLERRLSALSDYAMRNHDEQEKTALDHSTAFLPAENQASLQMDEQPISLLKAVTLKIRNTLSELQEQFR